MDEPRLKSSVRRRIEWFERESARELALQRGLTYRRLVATSSRAINAQHADPSSPTGFYPGPEGAPFPLRTIGDFWGYRRAVSRAVHDLAARVVGLGFERDRVGGLPVNLGVLAESVAPLYDAPLADGSAEVVARAVPVLHSAEPLFNAYATLESPGIDFPHVRHYYRGGRAMHLIALSLANNAFTFVAASGGVALRKPGDAMPATMAHPALRTVLAIFQGVRDGELVWSTEALPAYPVGARNTHIEAYRFGMHLYTGAELALTLHELGHHFLEHLGARSAPPHVVEPEADAFAVACLRAAGGEPEAPAAEDGYTRRAPSASLIFLAGGLTTYLTMSALYPDPGDYPAWGGRIAAFERAIETDHPGWKDLVDYLLLPLRAAVLLQRGQDPLEYWNTVAVPLAHRLDATGAFHGG